MAFPFKTRAIFSVTVAAVAGDTSGAAIEAAAGGKGVMVTRYEPVEGDDTGVKLTDAAVLDAGLATVTPSIVSDPDAVLTTVVRTGVEAAGLLPMPPDYLYHAASAGNLIFPSCEIFVPPGKFLTFLRTTVNAAFVASMGFTEL